MRIESARNEPRLRRWPGRAGSPRPAHLCGRPIVAARALAALCAGLGCLAGAIPAWGATNTFQAPAGMIWIPPGSFNMGCPESEVGRDPREGPPHRVTISQGFWLGRYEVTQAEFVSLMHTNPSAYQGSPQCPVESVSWEMAIHYCGLLTVGARAGRGLPPGYVYRLPTEAEWEYACRAGTTNRYSFGDRTELLSDYAWWGGGPEAGHPHPVGQKKPNRWGLYDMHGNVFEYCLEFYAPYPGGVPDSNTNVHIIRGGAFYCPDYVLRSACRTHTMAIDQGSNLTGFRVALAPIGPLEELQRRSAAAP